MFDPALSTADWLIGIRSPATWTFPLFPHICHAYTTIHSTWRNK
ncbi:hypothetical protein Mpsy_1660 [Methanolobus psychrophilus R15]|nr:hypothetical protein Mpsy_1660 [Methanolobus psychrophilus R15]